MNWKDLLIGAGIGFLLSYTLNVEEKLPPLSSAPASELEMVVAPEVLDWYTNPEQYRSKLMDGGVIPVDGVLHAALSYDLNQDGRSDLQMYFPMTQDQKVSEFPCLLVHDEDYDGTFDYTYRDNNVDGFIDEKVRYEYK